MVVGLDSSDLRRLCRSLRVSALRAFPRAAQLPQLLDGPSFAADVAHVDFLRLGTRVFFCLSGTGAQQLTTCVLRAPTAGLATELSLAAERAVRCLRTWLSPTRPGGVGVVPDGVEPTASGTATRAHNNSILYSLPGGCAAELQLDSLVKGLSRRLLSAEPSSGIEGDGRSAAGGSITNEGVDGSSAAGGGGGASEWPSVAARADALQILSAALRVLPRTLHHNGRLHPARELSGDRWAVAQHTLQLAHAASLRCTIGFIAHNGVSPTDAPLAASSGLAVGDAAAAGILEPLGSKLLLLEGVLGCLAQLLRLDDVQAARKRVEGERRRTQRRPAPPSGRSDSDTESSAESGTDGESDSEAG